MTLHLVRYDCNEHRTIGRLSFDGMFQCYTLEDRVRTGPKVAHETAIPEGRYPIVVTRSIRFGGSLPLLLNVPNFDSIRIHAGNTDKDTSGCLLVGMQRDVDSLMHSRLALGIVQQRIEAALAKGDQVWIEVEGVLKASRSGLAMNESEG